MLKRIMHCSQCGVANHNSRFHKKAQQVSLSFVVLTLLYLCDGSYGMILLSRLLSVTLLRLSLHRLKNNMFVLVLWLMC